MIFLNGHPLEPKLNDLVTRGLNFELEFEKNEEM